MSSSEDSFPSETSQLGDIREHVLDVFKPYLPLLLALTRILEIGICCARGSCRSRLGPRLLWLVHSYRGPSPR